MQVTSIIGVTVVSAVLCTLLARCYPEYAAAAALLTGVLVLLAVCRAVAPVFVLFHKLCTLAQVEEESAAAALKIIGLSWISALGSNICRDIGQTALAAKAELAGRIAVLLAVLPMFEGLLQLAEGLLRGRAG